MTDLENLVQKIRDREITTPDTFYSEIVRKTLYGDHDEEGIIDYEELPTEDVELPEKFGDGDRNLRHENYFLISPEKEQEVRQAFHGDQFDIKEYCEIQEGLAVIQVERKPFLKPREEYILDNYGVIIRTITGYEYVVPGELIWEKTTTIQDWASDYTQRYGRRISMLSDLVQEYISFRRELIEEIDVEEEAVSIQEVSLEWDVWNGKFPEEFSEIKKDKRGLTRKKKYTWRVVGIALIEDGEVTEKDRSLE